MAYQNPAFYFYHLARDGAVSVINFPDNGTSTHPYYDNRMGELYKRTTSIGTTTNTLRMTVNITNFTEDRYPEIWALDTVIMGPTNLGGSGGQGGNRLNAFTNDGDIRDIMVDPTYTEDMNGTIQMFPLKPGWAATSEGESFNRIDLNTNTNTQSAGEPTDGGYIVAEYGEVWFTAKREMSRGPEPNWRHPWRRSQRRFVNDAGVSSTWLTGPARKTYRLTWRHLYGADRQIMLDMKEQTADWSYPFFFSPPDDAYPLVLVELDRDGDWEQDFLDPLISGTSDAVTLPLIEVLG